MKLRMYKGENIGELPEGWISVKVGEYVTSVKGKKPKSLSSEKTSQNSIPYVNIKAFEKNIIEEYTDGMGCILCDDKDFLMVWDGSRSGYVGKGVKGAVGSTLVKLNFKEIENNYAFYFLQSKFLDLNTKAKGVGIPHVDPNILWNYDLLLPPKPIQQAIVSKIEELFSELDKGVENLRIAQQQLTTYRQSVLKWAFEGRLTNDNVKAGKLPEGWGHIQIKDVAETFGGYAFKSTEFETTGRYQVIRMGNVKQGVVRYQENPVFVNDVDKNVLNRTLLKINDVVITLTGTRKKRDYGFTTLIHKDNLLLNQRVAALRFGKTILPKFFLYFSWTLVFRDQFFLNETGNVGQGNVGMKAVTETSMVYPSVDDQHKVVQAIESRLSIADKLEETIAKSLQQAESLKQSILKKAFEGKLV
ncbi:restriction endonuclease subunit S [Chitinophaga sp. RAB17]|uniref:restriction endonuclease subunit S n=1 Tax=Chitinophaga sp. RAB17 TaxID=3233049 RepID=UPI003F8EC1BC